MDRLRILFVGFLGPMSTATHRLSAMQRLGHEVIGFDVRPYGNHGGPFFARLRFRTLLGRQIRKLNRDLIEAALERRPDIVWFDKAIYVHAATVMKIRAAGIYTIHHNVDNPFGPRNDHGWRLFLAALPEYDLHLVPREVNVSQYRDAGARDVQMLPFAFEPTLQFPPSVGWSDKDRLFDLIFIGFPYDRRAEFFEALWREHGIRTQIWGHRKWAKRLSPEAYAALYQGGQISYEDYREKIWRSRICFGFVTHSNRDEIGGRSVEIAACGSFLLAEDTPGHRAFFADGEEAVLFQTVEDCAEKIKRYLPDEAARDRIAKAGRARAETSGYSNDARIQQALNYVKPRLTSLIDHRGADPYQQTLRTVFS